jgi:antitoxin MazE
MRARVQRWGNSLALRIPKSFAAETHLDSGAEVDLSLIDGRLVITPITPAMYKLDDLLEAITPERLHGEVDTGPSTGVEVW